MPANLPAIVLKNKLFRVCFNVFLVLVRLACPMFVVAEISYCFCRFSVGDTSQHHLLSSQDTKREHKRTGRVQKMLEEARRKPTKTNRGGLVNNPLLQGSR
jgi:hypothetical protein